MSEPSEEIPAPKTEENEEMIAANQREAAQGLDLAALKEASEIRRELKESRDKYVRLMAEMENQRKRLKKESDERAISALTDVVSDILHPLDNLENALNHTTHMSEEVNNWAIGFKMILQQFKEALLQHGISPITSHGQPFDPHRHEAIEMHETHEHPPGIVVKEYRPGYILGERTIRPARVAVSKKPDPAISADQPIEGENNHSDQNEAKE